MHKTAGENPLGKKLRAAGSWKSNCSRRETGEGDSGTAARAPPLPRGLLELRPELQIQMQSELSSTVRTNVGVKNTANLKEILPLEKIL